VRLDRALDLFHLFHELGIDVQAARGVDDQDVINALARGLERLARDDRGRLLRVGRKESGANLLGQSLQLQDGGGTPDVRAD
jgi:hypothetical protein